MAKTPLQAILRAGSGWIAAALTLVPGLVAASEPAAPTFEQHVRSILNDHCVRCHGGEVRKARLDLRGLPGVLKGGESGEPAVVPGDPEASPLLESLASGAMPPDRGPKPTAEQIDQIRAWIQAGARGESPAEAGADPDAERRQQLALEVANLLDFRCVDCHGRNESKGGLDLRTAAAAIRGGKSGPAVVPGDPKASRLVARIADDQMPPRDGRFDLSIKPIVEPELDLIRRWIAEGAPEFPAREPLTEDALSISEEDRSWWAFRPPVRPEVPTVAHAGLVRDPIDAFLLARLEPAGLAFAPEADRRTLARRVTFDLTGLPPTPEEVDAFLADESPDAYERLVDRLLASPRFGERWAQPWLDAAGFVESEGGDGNDPVRGEFYLYRDYVVRSMNADKPFDRFVREQLAGDELANFHDLPRITPEQADNVVATGFLRTVVDPTDRPVHNFPPDRQQVLADTVSVVGSSLMGLTIGCARCHTHKYDPITHADYYRFSAIFAAAYSPLDWKKPRERLIPLASRAERAAAERDNKAIDETIKPVRERLKVEGDPYRDRLIGQRLAKLAETVKADLDKAPLSPGLTAGRALALLGEQLAALGAITEEELDKAFPDYRAASARIEAEIQALEAQRVTLPVARALVDNGPAPQPFYLQSRGDAYRRGSLVLPDVPTVLKASAADFEVEAPWPGSPASGRRLALARWITRPDHPLTARVFVNRVWQQVFGRGIVESVDNFGRTGAAPTHPELLDWLATRFVAEGWSQKALIRHLVTSRAYRQDSKARAEGLAADPANFLLWRMPLRRLQAEWIRDATLAVAGTLNLRMFGPSSPVVMDEQGLVEAASGPEHARRSLYMLHRRSEPLTMLDLFDAPRMGLNCLERRTSVVAPQALMLLNGRWIREQAEALARRVGPEAGPAEVDRLYRLVLNRSPGPDEQARALAFLGEQAVAYRDEPAAADKVDDPARRALTDLCQVLLNAPGFHYLD